jgi:TPR repeat protein
MYHYGYGVEVDFNMAQELYDKVATGNGEYAYKIAKVYHCDGELQDISKAVECYEKAESVNPFIMSSGYTIKLGILYLYGAGVEKDFKKAIEYFEKPGHIPFRYFYLGEAYYNGPDGIQDYNKAFQLFQNVGKWSGIIQSKTIFARYKNNPESSTDKEEKHSFAIEPRSVFLGETCYYLGIMYTKGQGTPQNEREAKTCFLRAVEYGSEKAKQYLGWNF